MDKLLMICDLFGCTLDDLVLGDVSASVNVGVAARGAAEDDHGSAAGTVTGEGAGEPAYMKDADGNSGESARSGGDGIDGPSSANALPGETLCGTSSSRPGALANVVALPQDLTGYDEHRCRFALLIAGGVAAIIAGVGVGNLFDSDNSILGVTPLNDFLTFLCICVGVIIGLAMLIPGDTSHTDFKRRHPYVEDFYTEEDRRRASPMAGRPQSCCCCAHPPFSTSSTAALRGDWSDVGSSAADGAMFWLPWPIGVVLCGVAAVAIQLIKDYRERK